MRFEPLGDQAVMARGETEAAAFAFADAVRRAPPTWCIDVVQAYSTVAVFYDPETTDYFRAVTELERAQLQPHEARLAATLHVIPCCYDHGPDLAHVAEQRGLTTAEVMALHTGTRYTVYAIGFCPGFPYLGYLPPQLTGVPRLATPRLRVAAGSVGMTGRQTGIYTEVRPGGWNIIGQTPLCLVDVADGYFPLRTGDEVEFRRIDDVEFQRLRGERLGVPAR
jgi:inhibitor of KinA